MKGKKKIFIVILLIILAIFIDVRLKNGKNPVYEPEKNAEEQKTKEEFVEILEDGSRINTSKELSKDRDLNGLKITNIQLVNSEGTTMLIADVENTTSSATELKPVLLKLLDKKGNVLTELQGVIAPTEPGGKTQINIGTTSNFVNSYDFEIEEVTDNLEVEETNE